LLSYVIDIDDTLISTKKRTQGLWRHVLGSDVSVEEVELLTPLQIFEKYATQDQKPSMRELQREFTDTMLCRNEIGKELMKIDEPLPDAADVLNIWHRKYKINYVTGRLDTIRFETHSQLKSFGFPLKNTELIMFKEEDWAKGQLSDAPRTLLERIIQKDEIIRVIDDFPGYFQVYQEYEIPERIGLIQSRIHTQRDFIERGATKVVKSWNELKDF